MIGGALVLRDQNHLTAVFSTTLGPYLLRKVDALRQLKAGSGLPWRGW